jgi:hypothetical protein
MIGHKMKKKNKKRTTTKKNGYEFYERAIQPLSKYRIFSNNVSSEIFIAIYS